VRSRQLKFVTALLAGGLVACGVGSFDETLRTERGAQGAATDEETPASEEAPADTTQERGIGATGPRFQAKSAAQLRASLEACVGAGATQVAADMIQTTAPGATPAADQRFLTPDFTVGQDIVDAQLELFDGVESALRSGVRPDQIGLAYVTALKNVGNVVGARCARGSVTTPALCECGTNEAAAAMLQRCLPLASPSHRDFADIAAELAVKCRVSKGGAVASLVASSAFARFR